MELKLYIIIKISKNSKTKYFKLFDDNITYIPLVKN